MQSSNKFTNTTASGRQKYRMDRRTRKRVEGSVVPVSRWRGLGIENEETEGSSVARGGREGAKTRWQRDGWRMGSMRMNGDMKLANKGKAGKAGSRLAHECELKQKKRGERGKGEGEEGREEGRGDDGGEKTTLLSIKTGSRQRITRRVCEAGGT
ncbi:hypothetical protein PENSPDRAFT_740043 [Peniophora sp. CONT]|nr:hypothetical protein PENSPDRAFT_740043 [Peniophora sp. CONT]